eukprot:1365196-Amphidinium_carterae.1
MLRQEACSGAMDDLAHVVTRNMMADLLTKSSAPSDPLILAVSTGTVPGADTYPPFRSTLRHHAFSSVYQPGLAPTVNCWTHSSSGPVYIKVSPDTELVVPSESSCPVLDKALTGVRLTLMSDSGSTVLEDNFRQVGKKKVQEHTGWTLFPVFPSSHLSDYWTSRHKNQLTRVHVKPRSALYSPTHTIHAPSVGLQRTTLMVQGDNTFTYKDSWNSAGSAPIKGMWT